MLPWYSGLCAETAPPVAVLSSRHTTARRRNVLGVLAG